MQNQKTLGFLIMRAQPLHSGHMELINNSIKNCDTLVIVIGSANSARTIKNPFTYQERKSQITQYLNLRGYENKTIIKPVNDYRYNDLAWVADVASMIDSIKSDKFDKVVMFGHDKPGNNYLKMFPQYEYMNFDAKFKGNATEIRKMWMEKESYRFDKSVMDDYRYFENEKKLFSNYPFKETLNFSCSDTILECNGHVLLIERSRAPGAGTWALPGGFKNNNETFLQCAIRELIEETNVRVPEKVLIGSIVSSRLFDDPARGMGIPRNTMCYHIKIQPNNNGTLPEIRPDDDALNANWFPISVIMNEMVLFDDHKDIIGIMTGVVESPADTKTE